MQIYMKDGKALWMNEKAITPKKATSETWVLNEFIPVNPNDDVTTFNTSFISNQTKFSTIEYSFAIVSVVSYDNTTVFGGRPEPEWTDQAYRTITFLEPPTGDLLTWLQANGTKQ